MCLEANEATPGDVCIYWHAFLYEINAVLRNPENSIPDDAVREIYGFLNFRHDELFGEGRISSSAELYYAGAYLDPGKFKSLNKVINKCDNLQLSCALIMTFSSVPMCLAPPPLKLTMKEYDIRLYSGWSHYSYQKSLPKRSRMGANWP